MFAQWRNRINNRCGTPSEGGFAFPAKFRFSGKPITVQDPRGKRRKITFLLAPINIIFNTITCRGPLLITALQKRVFLVIFCFVSEMVFAGVIYFCISITAILYIVKICVCSLETENLTKRWGTTLKRFRNLEINYRVRLISINYNFKLCA